MSFDRCVDDPPALVGVAYVGGDETCSHRTGRRQFLGFVAPADHDLGAGSEEPSRDPPAQAPGTARDDDDLAGEVEIPPGGGIAVPPGGGVEIPPGGGVEIIVHGGGAYETGLRRDGGPEVRDFWPSRVRQVGVHCLITRTSTP